MPVLQIFCLKGKDDDTFYSVTSQSSRQQQQQQQAGEKVLRMSKKRTFYRIYNLDHPSHSLFRQLEI